MLLTEGVLTKCAAAWIPVIRIPFGTSRSRCDVQMQLCRTVRIGSVFEPKVIVRSLPLCGRKAKGSADIPVNGDNTKRWMQVTPRFYILADGILCKKKFAEWREKVQCSSMWAGGRFVKVMYSLTMLGERAIWIGEESGILAALLRAEAITVQREWRVVGRYVFRLAKTCLIRLIRKRTIFAVVCAESALGVVLGLCIVSR